MRNRGIMFWLMFVTAAAASFCLGWKVSENAALRSEISLLLQEKDLDRNTISTLTDRLIYTKAQATTTGWASFYGKEFHGRPTASGIPFDSAAMVAASRWLRMGSWWRITRLDTGASCDVLIVDRGPYSELIYNKVTAWNDRVVDVSEGVAEKLGMVKKGLVYVVIEPL